MSIAWQTRNLKPAVDWTGVDIDAHNKAYQRARAEFIESEGYEPTTDAERSSIIRRASKIFKGELA